MVMSYQKRYRGGLFAVSKINNSPKHGAHFHFSSIIGREEATEEVTGEIEEA